MNFYQFNKKHLIMHLTDLKYQHLAGAFFSGVGSLRMNSRVQIPISEGRNTPAQGKLLHIKLDPIEFAQ
ncbi:hypothetical protein ACFTQ7_03620 [Lysinibacillus sp. NPDC056959]|uniref:hypothetical protein n=1 Tax=Lysinibacillus sp. NPDC056959 TaxID=3345981 RepID=UPI0036434E0E